MHGHPDPDAEAQRQNNLKEALNADVQRQNNVKEDLDVERQREDHKGGFQPKPNIQEAKQASQPKAKQADEKDKIDTIHRVDMLIAAKQFFKHLFSGLVRRLAESDQRGAFLAGQFLAEIGTLGTLPAVWDFAKRVKKGWVDNELNFSEAVKKAWKDTTTEVDLETIDYLANLGDQKKRKEHRERVDVLEQTHNPPNNDEASNPAASNPGNGNANEADSKHANSNVDNNPEANAHRPGSPRN
ncbi:MAG: hypothetical protein KIT27_00175 [Legionellales bacterium]|nr:hypothetical protein [Legionellales bacterium]